MPIGADSKGREKAKGDSTEGGCLPEATLGAALGGASYVPIWSFRKGFGKGLEKKKLITVDGLGPERPVKPLQQEMKGAPGRGGGGHKTGFIRF